MKKHLQRVMALILTAVLILGCVTMGFAVGSDGDDHVHTWVEVTTTVHHDEVGHYETVVLQEAYDEPVKETKLVCNYSGCGAYFDTVDDVCDHIDIVHDGNASYSSKKVTTGYIHHDAITEEVWIVDQEAYDESVITGYKCSECGATSEVLCHTHVWEEVTETVRHDEVGHYETVVLQEAYDEPIQETKAVCNACGAYFDTADEVLDHIDIVHDGGASYSVKKVTTGYIHHDAITEEVWVVDQEAYDETVVTGYRCSVCGATSEDGTPEGVGHFWDEGEITKAPTCTETGVRTFICTVCGETREETVEALGHTTVTDEAVAPTCTETGLTEGSHCGVCGEILKAQEVVLAAGHTWDEGKITRESTCTEAGVRTFTCTVCSDTKEEPVTTVPHTPVTDEAVAPTCTETGLTEGSHCGVCGEILKAQEVVPAAGHTWDEGKINRDPTCTEAGVRTYTCTACGDTKEEPVATVPHTPVIDEAVASTCTETGLAEGSHCGVCGEILKAQEIVPAVGHDWDEGVADTHESCTDTVITYTCKVCGATKSEPYYGNHTWNEGAVTKEPTCTEAGVRTFTCTACGDTKEEPVATVPHTPVIDEAVAPTCTETGLTEGSHCGVCGEILKAQEVVPATGHSFQWVTDREPTATEDGSRHEECVVCGQQGAAETIPATGTVDTDTDVEDNPADTGTDNGTTSPRTGDESKVIICGVTLILSMFIVAAIVVCGRRRRNT